MKWMTNHRLRILWKRKRYLIDPYRVYVTIIVVGGNRAINPGPGQGRSRCRSRKAALFDERASAPRRASRPLFKKEGSGQRGEVPIKDFSQSAVGNVNLGR